MTLKRIGFIKIATDLKASISRLTFFITALICYFIDTVPTPAEKSLSLQTSVSLDKKSDSTLTNTVTENPLQTPLEKQAAAKCSETLLSEEECVHPDLRTSSSGFSFYDRSSVETLYVSPSFKLVDPVKEAGISKDDQKPAHSGSVQMDDESLQAITVQGKFTQHTHAHTCTQCLF